MKKFYLYIGNTLSFVISTLKVSLISDFNLEPIGYKGVFYLLLTTKTLCGYRRR